MEKKIVFFSKIFTSDFSYFLVINKIAKLIFFA